MGEYLNKKGLNTFWNKIKSYVQTENTTIKSEVDAQLDTKASVDSLKNYALASDVPTKVSQLTNDSGYLTEHQSLKDYATTSYVSTNYVSNTALEQAAYIQASALEPYAKTEDIATTYVALRFLEANYLTSKEIANQYTKTADIEAKYATIEELVSYYVTVNYLTMNYITADAIKAEYAYKTEVPTKVSQLENDKNYLTEHQDISNLATTAQLEEKVDKETGKGLSQENFTTELKTKLAGLSNYDDTTLTNLVNNKVDKIDGMQLSTEDFTTAYKDKLDGIANKANNYVHPTTAGNKHIPAGGAVNNLLAWDSDGTAKWFDYDAKVNESLTFMLGAISETNDTVSTLQTKLDTVEEGANNYVHPTTSGYKHIPSGGSENDFLVWDSDGTAKWADSTDTFDLKFGILSNSLDTLSSQISDLEDKQTATTTKLTELDNTDITLTSEIDKIKSSLDLIGTYGLDMYSYGVAWTSGQESPTLTRVGNTALHKTLPIQSAYKGCVAKGNQIQYYLDDFYWSTGYIEDTTTGRFTDVAADLTGTDGTVKVYTPKFYAKQGYDDSTNQYYARISLLKIDDTWTEIPELLIDAYMSTVDASDAENIKLVSVVNTTANFRGGLYRADYDQYLTSNPYKCDLGKPATYLDRVTARQYAANAGGELLCYEYYKWIFYWNCVIEYATFNIRDDFNDRLGNDYPTGGLGVGITNLSTTTWTKINGHTAITPCGSGNSLGNYSGTFDLHLDATTDYNTITLTGTRYRGFENPFGDIDLILDGVVLNSESLNTTTPLAITKATASNVYTTTDPSEFTDVVGNKTYVASFYDTAGYVTEFNNNEITPEQPILGDTGTSTTFKCAYSQGNVNKYSNDTIRILVVQSNAETDEQAGPASLNASYKTDFFSAFAGYRTVHRNPIAPTLSDDSGGDDSGGELLG